MNTDLAKSKKSKSRSILYVLLLCALCIALNLVCNRLASAAGLPVYFDTLGTILAAATGGYLPGIITGFVTNIVNGFSDVTYAYYGTLNVLVAVFAAYFAEKGFFRKIPGIIVCILSFSLICGGIGACITTLLNYPSDLRSELVTALPIELIDKSVVTVAAALLLLVIPDKVKALFGYFKPRHLAVTKDASSAGRKQSIRLRSLRHKTVLIVAIAMIAVAAASTAVSFYLYNESSLEAHKKMGTSVASLAGSIVDANRVDEFIALGEAAEGYTDIETKLYEIRESSPDIEYVYIYKILPDGCHVVFDLDTEDVEGGEPGELIPFDESFGPYISTLISGGRIDPIITDDTYGWLLTAYEPVYDDGGSCVCYACVDISMNDLRAGQQTLLTEVLALFIGFFILILAISLRFADAKIVDPINRMAEAAGDFAYNSEAARASSVERFKSLEIDTGDEIENLYNAFAKTSEDSVKYITEVQERGEEINRLQNGLIMVLADMVESRDKCTGDHVRKTAAYVKVIIDELRREGQFTDILTDDYMTDVVNSAPLHDVGKIQVSDVLLNKPGRLTDDEFSQMQAHTTHGRAIIHRVEDMVGNRSGYLTEAENLAAYHHEKWNGKGYPHGLKGEEIPLSARIMAVADVFDALVSRRSYKEPFSIEDAFEIIKDGEGTHFDPVVAQAFLNAEPEVRRIAAENMDPAAEE